MKLTGKVMKSFIEERDIVSKEGIRRHLRIGHVMLLCEDEIADCTTYEHLDNMPKEGDLKWISPSIRKYENYKGTVATVVY